MKTFKTVTEITGAQITEKRSKFIATLAHVEDEQAALSFINKIKSQYFDAKHNVYAYSLSKSGIKKFSDDGEPHGTAGKPILDVITGNELDDAIIVVTRYFGGVLLGPGGLMRAYSSAALLAVENAQLCVMTPCIKTEINCEYTQYDKLSSIISNYSVHIISVDYADKVKVTLLLDISQKDAFSKETAEAFFGSIIPEFYEETSFPIKK